MTHTARSSIFRKSSGNSFETKPNRTQNPLIMPHVVHVYVASSEEIDIGSYVATIVCCCGCISLVDMSLVDMPPGGPISYALIASCDEGRQGRAFLTFCPTTAHLTFPHTRPPSARPPARRQQVASR